MKPNDDNIRFSYKSNKFYQIKSKYTQTTVDGSLEKNEQNPVWPKESTSTPFMQHALADELAICNLCSMCE